MLPYNGQEFLNMQVIVQIRFGSHLYGIATSASDLDIKGLYFPAARNILLQNVQPVISFQRVKAHKEKNIPDDVDYELYSPQKFFNLLTQGQIMALEMLFAPPSAMLVEPHPKWYEIKAIAPKLLTKHTVMLVRYCKHQANKYGVKGSRIAAVKMTLEHLIDAEKKYAPNTNLGIIADNLKVLADHSESLRIGETLEPSGNKIIYFEICGKKLLFNASIKSAISITQQLMRQYGERTLAAQSNNNNIDWKSLSHSVRIGYETIEFLTTGFITFPRPEANHLLNIKLGKVDYLQVSEEIEQLLAEIEASVIHSTLPESFDQTVMDDFIEQLYRECVQGND